MNWLRVALSSVVIAVLPSVAFAQEPTPEVPPPPEAAELKPAPPPLIEAPPPARQPSATRAGTEGRATEDPTSWSAPPRKLAVPRRTFGVGFGFGGGYSVGVLTGLGSSSSFGGPSLLLPTLELHAFLENGQSVDLSIPLINSVVSSLALGGFVAGIDGFYNFNIGSEQVRFLCGPGLGLGLAFAQGVSVIDFKVPVVLGVEFLTEGRIFGFGLQARPFVDLAIASRYGSSFGGFGGGFMGVLALNWYGTST